MNIIIVISGSFSMVPHSLSKSGIEDHYPTAVEALTESIQTFIIYNTPSDSGNNTSKKINGKSENTVYILQNIWKFLQKI